MMSFAQWGNALYSGEKSYAVVPNRKKFVGLAAAVLVIGFAAETGTDEEILAYGADKAARKGVDFICLNRVGATVGFGDVPNDIRLLDASGRVVGRYTGSKDEVAAGLADQIAAFLDSLER